MAEKGAEFGVLGPLQVGVDGCAGAAWYAQTAGGARHAADQHSYVSNIRKLLGRIGVDSRTALGASRRGTG
jgi:hypothetical protein